MSGRKNTIDDGNRYRLFGLEIDLVATTNIGDSTRYKFGTRVQYIYELLFQLILLQEEARRLILFALFLRIILRSIFFTRTEQKHIELRVKQLA